MSPDTVSCNSKGSNRSWIGDASTASFTGGAILVPVPDRCGPALMRYGPSGRPSIWEHRSNVRLGPGKEAAPTWAVGHNGRMPSTRAEPTVPGEGHGQREHILSTALSLMSQHGVTGTSMRSLAGATGLNVATLYHYFPSKRDLLVAVLEERGSWTTRPSTPRRPWPRTSLRPWPIC